MQSEFPTFELGDDKTPYEGEGSEGLIGVPIPKDVVDKLTALHIEVFSALRDEYPLPVKRSGVFSIVRNSFEDINVQMEWFRFLDLAYGDSESKVLMMRLSGLGKTGNVIPVYTMIPDLLAGIMDDDLKDFCRKSSDLFYYSFPKTARKMFDMVMSLKEKVFEIVIEDK